MDHVLQFFQQLDNLVWGAPLLVLLVGTGIYLTLRFGCGWQPSLEWRPSMQKGS